MHPGGLVSQDDIDRIQYLKDVEQDAAIVAAFNKLQANSHAKSTYNPNPQVRVDRGGTDYPDNYSIAMNDAAAAYQNRMHNLWYFRILYFPDLRHGRTCATGEEAHYMSNWGLCNVLAVMSIGILCDDADIYNRGLHYYKDDICGNFTDEDRNPTRATGNNECCGWRQ